jgi:hypothetical protein
VDNYLHASTKPKLLKQVCVGVHQVYGMLALCLLQQLGFAWVTACDSYLHASTKPKLLKQVR